MFGVRFAATRRCPLCHARMGEDRAVYARYRGARVHSYCLRDRLPPAAAQAAIAARARGVWARRVLAALILLGLVWAIAVAP